MALDTDIEIILEERFKQNFVKTPPKKFFFTIKDKNTCNNYISSNILSIYNFIFQ